MLMAPVGHRRAHRAQRMHLVASIIISGAVPVAVAIGPGVGESGKPVMAWTRVATARSPVIWLMGTMRRQYSGQTSTHPPHRMHRVASKIVWMPHRTPRAGGAC